jgi:hypothetical protein
MITQPEFGSGVTLGVHVKVMVGVRLGVSDAANSGIVSQSPACTVTSESITHKS